MTNKPGDRRIQRTRKLLIGAIMRLVSEKPFEKITIQDILEQADAGRTTFYDHFQSKEDLFLSSHEHMLGAISHSFFTQDGALRAEPSVELVSFLQVSQQSRDTYFHLTTGSEGSEILRRLKEHIAEQLLIRLRGSFQEETSKIPFPVLAQQVASSIVSISNWWMDKRTPYSVEALARMLHQMNYATLRDALENQL